MPQSLNKLHSSLFSCNHNKIISQWISLWSWWHPSVCPSKFHLYSPNILFHHPYNASLALCHFSDPWKWDNIVPIFKCGKTHIIQIAIVRSLYLATVVRCWNSLLSLSYTITLPSILQYPQIGFRQTVLQLFRLIETLSTNTDRRFIFVLLSLDIP